MHRQLVAGQAKVRLLVGAEKQKTEKEQLGRREFKFKPVGYRICFSPIFFFGDFQGFSCEASPPRFSAAPTRPSLI